MSRCFPYPPPGYVRNGARGEAVNESIKLQRDSKNAITEHDKKKNKEKNERKKSRKEKKESISVATHNLPEKSLPVATFNQLEKGLFKGKEEEAERSSLTEEHEQPMCSQSFCCSSDSTRSSNKRKADDLLHTATNATKNHGNIIRIRLPLQRHIETNPSSNGEQLCSTSVRLDYLPEQKQVKAISRQERCGSINSKTVGEPTSASVIPTSSADLESKGKSSRHLSKTEKKAQKAESRYKTLFEGWVPPPVDYEQTNFDDQEWLSDTKRYEESLGNKRLKNSHHDVPCHVGLALWPCAYHLPQADLFALPYTIPF